MRSLCLNILLLASTALFISSCAPVSLVNTWHNPAAPEHPFRKLLVVSVAPDAVARQLFEAVLVAELKKRGVEAVPCSSLLPGNEQPNRTVVEKAVHQSGAGGIISLQLDRLASQTTVVPAYTMTYSMGWYPDAFYAWDFYNYYGATTVYVPPTVIIEQKWMVRATFFNAADGKLLWAGTFQTVKPEQYIAIGEDVAKTVVDRLVQEGII